MCYYSSDTVVVTSSSLGIRVALPKLFYLYILFFFFYYDAAFSPCLRKYFYMYTGKKRTGRGSSSFFSFLLFLFLILHNLSPWNTEKISARTIYLFARSPLSREGKSHARLASQIRSVIIAIADGVKTITLGIQIRANRTVYV